MDLALLPLAVGGGLLATFAMSGLTYHHLYACATPATRRHKLNPAYPTAPVVARELLMSARGVAISSAVLWASWCLQRDAVPLLPARGRGWWWRRLTAAVALTDAYEYLYHYLGHAVPAMWRLHRHHHRFPNPTPFGVVADEPSDQLMRSLYLVFVPWVTGLDWLSLLGLSLVYYAYGIYLHCGHDWFDAHGPVMNTSYHHWRHHATSGRLNPAYVGFFVRWWDDLFGSTEPDCRCLACQGPRAPAPSRAPRPPPPSLGAVLAAAAREVGVGKDTKDGPGAEERKFPRAGAPGDAAPRAGGARRRGQERGPRVPRGPAGPGEADGVDGLD